MGEFDNTLGALSIGFVFAVTLYGVMCVQTFSYYNAFVKDRTWIKCLVAFLWVLDTLQIISIGHTLYFYMVSNFDNLPSLFNAPWSLALGVLFTNLIVVIVELFLARRVYIVSRGMWILPMIISILSLTYFCCEMVSKADAFKFMKVASFIKFETPASIGLSCAAAADILIALALCWYLHKSRTGFKRTDNIINVLLLYAVNTGALTSICGLADMICFVTMPTNFVHLSFNIVVGKLYTNSLLATLNARTTLSAQTDVSGYAMGPMSYNSGQDTAIHRTGRVVGPGDFNISLSTEVNIQTDTMKANEHYIQNEV